MDYMKLLTDISHLLTPCKKLEFKPEYIPQIYNLLTENNFQQIRCILLAMLKKYRKDLTKDEILPLENEKFLQLCDVKFLSAGGEFGLVFTLSQKGVSEPFAIGKYTTAKNEIMILQEIASGLLLNTLRDKVENFMYCYGGFACSVYDEVEKICSGKSKDNIKKIALFEYINNSETFESLLLHLDIKDIFKIILQIVYALKIAFDEFLFHHGDLHTENVLIQTLENKKEIKIYDYVFETNLIPKIIDYGFASFEVNRQVKLFPIRKENSINFDLRFIWKSLQSKKCKRDKKLHEFINVLSTLPVDELIDDIIIFLKK